MKYSRLQSRIGMIVICIVLASLRLPAQQQANPLQSDPSTVTLRLAEAYERAGDYEKALPLFEQLYRRDVSNIVTFDALRRMYMQLKRYDSAAAIVSRRVEQFGDDLSLVGELGNCYYKWGKEDLAFDTWNRALSTFDHTPTAYRVIANFLIENRLYDKAIRMLEEARGRGAEQSSFTQQIAQLYAMTFRYEEATREYCSTVVSNGMAMLEFARLRISSYISKPEAQPLVLKVARGEISKYDENVPLLTLCAWIYQEAKQYDDAFSVYNRIDALTKAQGREILGFAERIMADRAYGTASKAFREFIDRYPTHASIPQAKYGYAKAKEELAMQSDSTLRRRSEPGRAGSGLPAAVDSYRALATEYPQNMYARQALYRIALIKFNVFFDLDGALAALDEIRSRYPESAVQPEIAITSGDVQLTRGDLDHAQLDYGALLRPTATVAQAQRDAAFFKCIMIEYYRGEFDSVLTHLAPLTRQTTSDIANDAISLQLFVQQHRENNDEALRSYAHADFLSAQHKYTEAIATFEDILRRFPRSLLLDDVLLSIGNLMRSSGQYAKSLDSYTRLVNEYPESIYADKALIATAEIYQSDLHDKEKAIAVYESILSKYPDSLMAGEVRKRIRLLRGESL